MHARDEHSDDESTLATEHAAARAAASATVLVIDDDHAIRMALCGRLADYEALEAPDCARGLELFRGGVDVVLLDHRLPDGNGLDLLRELRAIDPDVPVIMLTAHSSVGQAVEAMKAGAYHYAAKPISVDSVALIVERALESTRLSRELRALRDKVRQSDPLIGGCAAMLEVKNLLARVAVSPASTVLITGESGTGKDLAARAIHDASERANGPFLNVTCSALAATLLESELFGHEPGAFTDARTRKKGLLEVAHGGTLFLDEIGDADLSIQVKLLRFLEEKKLRRVGGTSDIRADVRVIAATNVDLPKAVKERRFREDLFYRLAVISVAMPPLRERGDDVLLLAHYFVDRFSRQFKKKIKGITAQAKSVLTNYAWPGNVRELKNCVERAVLLANDEMLGPKDFAALSAAGAVDAVFQLPPNGVNLAELERSLVTQALERCGGNRTRAGELLGLNRDQVRYRIKVHDLEPDRDDARA